MAALKYSRQREAIKKYLMSTESHPTADTVYLHVNREFPNISLATVYRNLNLLTDIGEAIKITLSGSADRFDGIVTPHNHFFCTSCGKVINLDFNIEELEEINKTAAQNFDGKIESSNITFYGRCSDCIFRSKRIGNHRPQE